MSALREMQRALRAAILDRGRGVPPGLIAGAAEDVVERLAIYRNNALGALAGALRLTYPACHRMVGDAFFDRAAAEFACRRPPRSAWLDDWGAGFAEFLEDWYPAAGLPWLPDLARLECAAAEAARTDLEPVLALSALAGPAGADPEALRFLAHPSVRLLESRFPVERMWRAALADDAAAMAAIDPGAGGACLLVRRAPDGAEVVALTEAGLRFTRALLSGSPLGVALEAVPAEADGRTLALHLAGASFRGVGHCP